MCAYRCLAGRAACGRGKSATCATCAAFLPSRPLGATRRGANEATICTKESATRGGAQCSRVPAPGGPAGAPFARPAAAAAETCARNLPDCATNCFCCSRDRRSKKYCTCPYSDKDQTAQTRTTIPGPDYRESRPGRDQHQAQTRARPGAGSDPRGSRPGPEHYHAKSRQRLYTPQNNSDTHF